jgi:NADH-quinone oxidoreductase subunit E
LTEYDSGKTRYNASVQLAVDIGDTVKRIDGTEVPLSMPWQGANKNAAPAAKKPAKKPAAKSEPVSVPAAAQPDALKGPREEGADDLKRISGVGPKLEGVLNGIGIYHFDQIASWSEAEVAWADQNLVGFKGRVSRDDWVGQAKALADKEK